MHINFFEKINHAILLIYKKEDMIIFKNQYIRDIFIEKI